MRERGRGGELGSGGELAGVASEMATFSYRYLFPALNTHSPSFWTHGAALFEAHEAVEAEWRRSKFDELARRCDSR